MIGLCCVLHGSLKQQQEWIKRLRKRHFMMCEVTCAQQEADVIRLWEHFQANQAAPFIVVVVTAKENMCYTLEGKVTEFQLDIRCDDQAAAARAFRRIDEFYLFRPG